jgi:hypothetical protein
MGCWEGSLCNPNYKRLSIPNGTNLTNSKSWLARTFTNPKLHITFEIEVEYSNGGGYVERLSSEVIYWIPDILLKDVLIQYVKEIKNRKSKEYDEICKNSILDPSKTKIIICYTNNSHQFVDNRYKSFKTIVIETENGIEYYINLVGKWMRQGSRSAFNKTRQDLSLQSYSTAPRTRGTGSFGDGTGESNLSFVLNQNKPGLIGKEKIEQSTTKRKSSRKESKTHRHKKKDRTSKKSKSKFKSKSKKKVKSKV